MGRSGKKKRHVRTETGHLGHIKAIRGHLLPTMIYPSIRFEPVMGVIRSLKLTETPWRLAKVTSLI